MSNEKKGQTVISCMKFSSLERGRPKKQTVLFCSEIPRGLSPGFWAAWKLCKVPFFQGVEDGCQRSC